MSNLEDQKTKYTAADALTDALVQAGVSYAFVNTGTDYPPIIESWAKYDVNGLPKPEVVICPHEMVAMSAAQGYAQATGQAQAVFIHVDVGTQNLGGSIHNVYRNRVPAFILAGMSPITMEGELKGTRNSYIQFIQNVSDQGSIVREYTKFNQEIRTGKNIQQLVYRAMQIANSEPKGPVYLMAAREPLEEESRNIQADKKLWGPISPIGLSDESVETLTEALSNAKNPLILTSYLGRNTECVGELVKLSERLAIPVVEVGPSFMNFPADNPMHLGFFAPPYLKNADLILVIDCDLPWAPVMTKPKDDCRVFYLDVDPLKEQIPLWYIPSEEFIKADSYTALKQLNRHMGSISIANPDSIEERRTKIEKLHNQMRSEWASKEAMQETMTPEFVTACLREIVDEDTIILNETISHHAFVERHLPRTKPGTLFTSGGSALGWHAGAAIGVKLAHPDKNVVALSGDGVYIFSCPTAAYWVARKYNTPFLNVIFNNQGWGAPRTATIGEHPDGNAAKHDKYWVSFTPASRLDLVAEAAGGAFARTVSDPKELKAALLEGMNAVKNGNCAVINVILPPISKQEI